MNNSHGLDTTGNWFRGNLHTHTTISDGKCSPEEVVSLYKKQGWDFLAITDHQIYMRHEELSSNDFLLLPGIELESTQPNPKRIYHVLGIGGQSSKTCKITTGQHIPVPQWNGLQTAQHAIDSLNQADNTTVFCHPNWSRLELNDFIGLQNYSALEIFNYGCEREDHTGSSVAYWDSLLRRGHKIWAVATDDSHQRIVDWCGGWIDVNCNELTVSCITSAIKDGNFYASSGPTISKYTLESGKIQIECSPCAAIHFVTYECWGQSVYAQQGETLTSAEYAITGKENYIRVECVDTSGKTAWSNPIFF